MYCTKNIKKKIKNNFKSLGNVGSKEVNVILSSTEDKRKIGGTLQKATKYQKIKIYKLDQS